MDEVAQPRMRPRGTGQQQRPAMHTHALRTAMRRRLCAASPCARTANSPAYSRMTAMVPMWWIVSMVSTLRRHVSSSA